MIDPVAIRLAGQTEQKEWTEFRERRVNRREQTQMWADWTWRQQRHASRDKSVQAFSSLFVLQATKAWACRPENKATTTYHTHATHGSLLIYKNNIPIIELYTRRKLSLPIASWRKKWLMENSLEQGPGCWWRRMKWRT